MQQLDIHRFLERFVLSNNCTLVSNEPGKMVIQLTEEMDKALMNRPFYWHYLEKTGGTPQPMKVTWFTDPNKKDIKDRGEVIHFGSPRLHQLFRTALQRGRTTRLYEEVEANENRAIPLYPWLILNVRISYNAHRRKDVLRSIGLQLIHGQMIDGIMEKIEHLHFHPSPCDFSFSMSPLIKPESGLKRIQKQLLHELSQEEHYWASEALEKMEDDLQLLDRFYEHSEEKPDTYHAEREAIISQYSPSVELSIVNGGMFYLQTQTFS